MPIHTIFLFDTSASMFGASFEVLKEGYVFISRTLHKIFDANDATWFLSIVAFNSTAELLVEKQPMTEQTAVDLQVLTEINIGSISNLGHACRFIGSHFQAAPADTFLWILLFSDGLFTDDWEKDLTALMPVTWFNVRCGAQADLQALASHASEEITLSNYDDVTLSNRLRRYLHTITGTSTLTH